MEHQGARIALLVAVWYGTSALCSLWSQYYLVPPGGLPTDVNTLVSVLTLVQSAFCAAGQLSSLSQNAATVVPRRQARLMGTFNFVTTWCMNAAMARSSMACAQSIRGLEPLLAAALSFVLHKTSKRVDSPSRSLIALLLITGGISLATWRSGQCTSVGLTVAGLAAASSNVLRNASVKTSGIAVDANLMWFAFAHSTLLSIPAVCASTAYDRWLSPGSTPFADYVSIWLPAIGITSMIYNTASLYVCGAVSLITHSTLTVVKRPLTIILAAAAGGLWLSRQMVIGNVVAAIGLLLYGRPDWARSTKAPAIVLAAGLMLYGLLPSGTMPGKASFRIIPDPEAAAAAAQLQHLNSLVATAAELEAGIQQPLKLGLIYPINVDPTGNYSDSLKRAGANFGNRVWWEGTASLYSHAKVDSIRMFNDPKPCDIALFSTANILWNDTSYTQDLENSGFFAWMRRLTAILQDMDKPIVAMGLGSNGFLRPTDENPHYYSDLDPTGQLVARPDLERFAHDARELLDTIQSRCPRFFVRGTYTETACHRQGFNKAASVGCPSLFINPTTTLGTTLQAAFGALKTRVHDKSFRFALTLPGYFAPKVFTLMLKILADYPGSSIIIQDDRDVNNLVLAREQLTDVPASTHDLAQKQKRHFQSVAEWKMYYDEHVDAVYGWRIHGAMMGVACGIPALLISPDMRVYELAEAMLVPTVTPYDPDLSRGDYNPIEQIANVVFDGAAFDANRKRKARTYVEAFLEVGLPPSQALLDIMTS